MTTNAKQSLNRRRDVRTEDQFKKDIKEATERERRLLKLWIKEMEYLGHKIVATNNGVDNSGEFVEFSNNDPDYNIIIDDSPSCLYEIKQNPFDHRNSFKVYDLQSYIKVNAKILLFYGTSKTGGLTDKTRWAIIEPEAMQRMLLLPSTSGDVKWGYKPIVIVWQPDFYKYFESKEFNIHE